MEEDADCCAVCLGPIHSNASETSCGHRFHTTCLLRSFAVGSTCPLCREELIPTGVKNEIRLSRLESTRRTNAESQHYRTLLEDTEQQDEALHGSHKRWVEHETEYTAADSEFSDHYRRMVSNIKRTRTYRALERDRALKRGRVATSKSVFVRDMERAIGDPPDGFVDSFLRDREILGPSA